MRNGIEEHCEVRLLRFTLDVDWPVPLLSGCVVEWGFWGAGELGRVWAVLGLGLLGICFPATSISIEGMLMLAKSEKI